MVQPGPFWCRVVLWCKANRTNVELKLHKHISALMHLLPCNRTNVELKKVVHAEMPQRNARHPVIEPTWT